MPHHPFSMRKSFVFRVDEGPGADAMKDLQRDKDDGIALLTEMREGFEAQLQAKREELNAGIDAHLRGIARIAGADVSTIPDGADMTVVMDFADDTGIALFCLINEEDDEDEDEGLDIPAMLRSALSGK
jgi:hypothetical protein